MVGKNSFFTIMLLVCICVLALGSWVSYSALAQGPDSSPSIKAYIDGKPGAIAFTQQLSPSLRARIAAGQAITHDRGQTLVVFPLDSPPLHYAVVTLSSNVETYVHRVSQLPVPSGVVVTMAIDIPAYGVSVQTFVSPGDPRSIVRSYVTELTPLHWTRLSESHREHGTGIARLMRNGDVLELRVTPRAAGTTGTLWLNQGRRR